MKVVLIGLNARFTHSCLALFYIRNEIERHTKGISSRIVQFTINDPYYQLLLHVGETEADCFFFSAAIWNSELVTRLAADLLDLYPEKRVVVGGPQAEIVGAAISHEHLCVVVGEIEGVGLGFFEDLQAGKLGRRYQAGSTRRGFSAPYCDDDIDIHLRNRHIYYETSRGCPFSCTYCLSASQKGVYHKDLETLTTELDRVLTHNPKVVRFIDRTFNDNGERALAIWRYLAAYPCDTLFHFEISPDRFSEEMFAFLAGLPVGKFQFEIGIQSTNPDTLKAIRRPMRTDIAHDTITRLSEMDNIHLHVDLILGLPGDTEATFMNSFRDVFAMRPHYIQMGLLKILPDTPICHTAPEDGYVYSSRPPYSVLKSRWLEHRSLRYLYWFGECVERFVNTRYFVSFWNYCRKKEIDIVGFFESVLEACFEKEFFHRAPTQLFLTSIILDVVDGWEERDYIVELLRYDWLRCGHRYIPEELAVEEERASRLAKKRLHREIGRLQQPAGQDVDVMYVLKKGFVLEMVPPFIQESSGRHFLCFTPEREDSLWGFNRVATFFLPGNNG